ncbi:MAG: Rv1157c family protein, partial [Mycobacterium sp.]
AAPVAAPAPEAAPAPAPEAPPAPEAAPAPAPAANPEFGPDAPPTQDFMYPSISNGCLSDGGNVLATAISVAGPAKIPTPGPGPGQTAYVFTAVGTPGPAAEQKLPLNVTWVNLTTGKSGGATLKPRPDINPEGPTTLTAIADTGSGSVMSTIFGQVTTTEKQCQFMPTIGSTVVP